MSDVITCIYCKQERPPSREHILARSLGGDATRPVTCIQCNTVALSALDHALAERSMVALSRAAYTPATAFDVRVGGEHFHHDVDRGIHVEVNLVNEFRAEPFPQIHLHVDTGQVQVVARDRDQVRSLVALVDRRIAEGALHTMHVKVGPSEYCSTARLVMHRSKDAFARVRESADAEPFFNRLRTAWPKLREAMVGNSFVAERTPQPTIRISIPVRLDDVYRAVAKTAFNVLAMRIGVTFALSPEFDELREYVLGRDIRHPENLEPEEIAVDGRFVREVPFGEPPLVPTEEHAVSLFYERGQMLAYVTLYKMHSFVVILGTISLPEPVLATHEFSTVRSGNAALEIDEVYHRLVRRGRRE